MQIETKYKGFGIVYNENLDKWVCEEFNIDKEKLRDVKSKIDEILKKEQKPKNPLRCFIYDYGRIEEKIITSATTEINEWNKKEGVIVGFWMTDANGKGRRGREVRKKIIREDNLQAIKKQIEVVRLAEKRLAEIVSGNVFLSDREVMQKMGYSEEYIKSIFDAEIKEEK